MRLLTGAAGLLAIGAAALSAPLGAASAASSALWIADTAGGRLYRVTR